jgi:hypothetical protein
MAFNADSMILMAHGYNHKLYHYVTTDAAGTIDGAGYFNAFAEQLDIGDVIKAITVDDIETPTSVSGASEHIVVSNAGGVVDVSNTLLGSWSDSD